MAGMVTYRRTQTVRLDVTASLYFGWVALVIAIGGWRVFVEVMPRLAIPLAVLSILFYGFRSLMVSVTWSHVELAYSSGWPSKRIERADIVKVETFRMPWWYGLGIRLTPKGWMWSIWGRSAVLLTLANGKGFLIGTDDPEGLAAALG